MQGFEVADDALKTISLRKNLRSLSISDGKNVTDRGVKSIAKLPSLQQLILDNTAVSTGGLIAFAGHQALTTLEICNTIFDYQSKSIELKDMPNLKTLSLNVEGVESVKLSSLPRLEQVDVFPRTLSAASLQGLGMVEELNFYGTNLQKLTVEQMPRLNLIDVRKTSLSEKQLEDIFKKLPKVKLKT